jgi:hypothetical protein
LSVTSRPGNSIWGFIDGAAKFNLDGPAYDVNNTDFIVGDKGLSGYLYDPSVIFFPYTEIRYAGSTLTSAQGLNDSGEVVGYYQDGTGYHGFTYLAGSYVPYPDVVTGKTYLTGINNQGWIVGYYYDASGIAHSFLDINGALPGGFQTVGDDFGAKGVFAEGLNDADQIVGYYYDSSNVAHSFFANPSIEPALIERVSLADDGTQLNEFSGGLSLSADGRYVAYATGTLGPIYVYDRATKTREVVSVTPTGGQPKGAVGGSIISDNGRYVAFDGFSDDLVSNDTNLHIDAFVYDRVAHTTELVSVKSDGSQFNAHSRLQALSGDGRYAVFENDSDGLLLRDRTLDTTESIGAVADGASISADGRYVAFSSNDRNLVAGDTNNAADIFVFDRVTRTAERVLAYDGNEALGSGDILPRTAISADGRYVAFVSSASNLVPGDTNNFADVFVYDRVSHTTERVSVATDGTQANDASGAISLSADGRYISFISGASNLVSGDTNNVQDVFVHDRITHTTQRVSVRADGTQSAGGPIQPQFTALSDDGHFIAFDDSASDLVPGDTNGVADTFVVDRSLLGVNGDAVHQGITTTPATLSIGSPVNGTIDADPMNSDISISLPDGAGGYVDKDWYQVTLSKGQIYTFTGTQTSITSGLMDISLYGQNGSQVHAAVEAASPSFTFDTTYQSSATQTYYLAVSAGGPEPTWKTATGGYSVSLTAQTSTTTDTIPGSLLSNEPLPLGTKTGNIDSSDLISGGPDDDYYKLTLTGGEKYTFIANADISASDTLDSVIIRLRDGNDNILATETAAGPHPRLDYTVQGSGPQTFFLEIGASSIESSNGVPTDQKTGRYSITLNDDGSTNSTGFDNDLNSDTAVEAGFDISTYPTNEVMQSLWNSTNLRWVGFYLPNTPNHPDTSWHSTRETLIDQGWTLFPLYVGQQDPVYAQQYHDNPINHGKYLASNPAGGQGSTDGDEAVTKMIAEGFSAYTGTPVYLDWESGGTLSLDEKAYIAKWCAAVSENGFVPGVYCPGPVTGQITSTTLFWISSYFYLDKTPILRAPIGASYNFPTDASLSPHPDATAWQYQTGYNITAPGIVGGALNGVDLDIGRVAASQTISADSVQDAPIVGNNGVFAIQGTTTGANTSLTVGPQGILNSLTGDIKAVFSQFSEFLFNGGIFNDVVKLLPVSAAGISSHTAFFNGNAGDDTLDGSATDTSIVASGGSGNDTLIGGPANDVLNGDTGSDVLTGRAGADTFAFGMAALADGKVGIFDRITDYKQGNTGAYNAAEGDQIDLSALLSAAFQSGQPISSLIRAIEVGNAAMFQINSDGMGFVTIAQLAGVHMGDGIYAILDPSQPVGVSIAVVAAPPSNPPAAPSTTADLILRRADGTFEIYNIGSNAILAGYSLGQVATAWQYAGLGRFFSSDSADIMLRNTVTGGFQVYDTVNNNITATALLGQVGLEWNVAGFGHFMAGGAETDMMLTFSNNGVTSFEAYGISDNKITTAGLFGRVGTEWQVAGFGPGNGTTDMVSKRDDSNNVITYGLYHDIKNNQFNDFSVVGKVGSEWNVVGFADLSGNGTSDMIVRRTGDNAFGVYHDINDNRFTAFTLVGPVGSEWQVMGFGPIGQAGRDEMLTRRNSDGMFAEYTITNNQFTFNTLGAVGTDWQFNGIAAGAAGGSVGGSGAGGGTADSTAQLVQAMAGFGGGSGAADGLNTVPLAGDTPQQPLLTSPQHA